MLTLTGKTLCIINVNEQLETGTKELSCAVISQGVNYSAAATFHSCHAFFSLCDTSSKIPAVMRMCIHVTVDTKQSGINVYMYVV